MQNICTQCTATFVITDEDRAFLQKLSPVIGGKTFSLPLPKLCPDCRHQLRMAFRNERHLYHRECSLCKKSIISIYDKETTFPVYCHDCWWSDRWDSLSYGKPYDQERPFLEQFEVLLKTVPRLSIVIAHNENCDYCNYVNYSKDSYLSFGCHSIDKCYHCWRAHWSESCADCLQLDHGTLCYECVDCDDCYDVRFSQDCADCKNSAFLEDCKSCSDCVCCAGLRNKKHCVFNKQHSKEEFETIRKEMKLDTREGISFTQKQFAAFCMTVPHRAVFIVNSENAAGDHIWTSRNVSECYHVKDAEDCRYLESCQKIKDSMDNSISGWPAELIYETMSAGVNVYSGFFCTTCWSCSNILYCDSCHHSQNLLGCVGLQKKSFCILNKQYTKEECMSLSKRILESMLTKGEFGFFFPSAFTPHAYNETLAAEFYPLKKDEAQKRGFQWKENTDVVPVVKKTIDAAALPSTINDVPDDVLHWAIRCQATGRPFRIIKQELDFYRQMHLPIPSLHPDERHHRRMALRNPRKLWSRKCGKCGNGIETTYSPDRPERVYCEECYLKEVY